MPTAASTLRSIALENPATIRVFERHNLDYCCGGRRPLAEACTEKGIATETVLAELEAALAQQNAPEKDLSKAGAAEIISHINQTHHVYVRSELPRLAPLAEKVALKHGPAHPEYVQLQRQLRTLNNELLDHLMKEEQILFPYVEAIERNLQGAGEAPHACFATVGSPIRQMLHEHEAAGALMAKMRANTNNFTPPADACPTLAGLLHGLDEFERDLHRHIHLENNLLFPLAISLEEKAMASA
jgi:regulator of cell morphogenesis and NO signaling